MPGGQSAFQEAAPVAEHMLEIGIGMRPGIGADEAGNALGMLDGHDLADGAAGRMADDMRPFDAAGLHHAQHIGRTRDGHRA